METTTITTLNQLLNDELSTLYGIELRLKEMLPRWIDKTHHLILKNLLRDYLYHVNRHTENLLNCGITGSDTVNQVPEKFANYYLSDMTLKLENCNPEILDAYLLASIQTVNHMKLSCYGTAAAWAQLLELHDVSMLLQDASLNEKQCNERLGELAQRYINNKARAPFAIMQ